MSGVTGRVGVAVVRQLRTALRSPTISGSMGRVFGLPRHAPVTGTLRHLGSPGSTCDGVFTARLLLQTRLYVTGGASARDDALVERYAGALDHRAGHPFAEMERPESSLLDMAAEAVPQSAVEGAPAVERKPGGAVRLRRRHVLRDGVTVHTVGRRKTAVARVYLTPVSAAPWRASSGDAGTTPTVVEAMPIASATTEEPRFTVNGRDLADYFPREDHRLQVLRPFIVTDTERMFHVQAQIHGGGITGQAEALRHGIARALEDVRQHWRPALKADGLLTRDARMVERKKYGRHKARRGFQWTKR